MSCDSGQNIQQRFSDQSSYVAYRLHRIMPNVTESSLQETHDYDAKSDLDIMFKSVTDMRCYPKYALVFNYSDIKDSKYQVAKIEPGLYAANRYFVTNSAWLDPVYSFTVAAGKNIYIGDFYFHSDGNVVVRNDIQSAKRALKIDLAQAITNYIPRPPDKVCTP
jgi:hypothetical protein